MRLTHATARAYIQAHIMVMVIVVLDKLRCMAGSVTDIQRSKLIMTRLMIDAVPHKMSYVM